MILNVAIFVHSEFSDSLVFEAAGGESAAKAFRENDEKGHQQAEVIVLDLLGIAVLLFVCQLSY